MPELRTGSPRGRCSACGEYFNSDSAFDKHRIGAFPGEPEKLKKLGPRRCMNVLEMQAKGMSKNDDGFWVTQKFKWRSGDGIESKG